MEALELCELMAETTYELMAGILIELIRSNMRNYTLEPNSLLIRKFPQGPYDSPVLEGLKHIFDALIAQNNDDLEKAESFWKKAL